MVKTKVINGKNKKKVKTEKINKKKSSKITKSLKPVKKPKVKNHDEQMEEDLFEEDNGTEEESGEENSEILDHSEGLAHKKALENLKETDPEFYKYLEENDKALLDFDVSSNDDDDDASDVEDDKFHKPPQPGELEADSDEEDFEKVKLSHRTVTLKMVQEWQEKLIKDKTVGTIAKVIKAFHAALVSVAGNTEDEVPEYNVEGSSVFNAVVQLCVLDLYPAIVKFLNLPKESAALAKTDPASSKNWTKLKVILRSYFADMFKLLGSVASDHILCVLLKHLHQMSIFVTYFKQLIRSYFKRLITLWSESNEETVRVLAFLCILRMTTIKQKMWLDDVLKMMYVAYISNSKFVSPSTLPGINFMRRSLTELFALSPTISYNHAFLYIRQLAIHLRNAITLHKKECVQAVYNWQYMSSLQLWTDLIGAAYDKPLLQSLLYPLVQVIIGCIRLIPTSQYYPLRFHCIQMLISLVRDTGTYIPIVPFIVEILTLTDFNKAHKKLSMKPMDLSCILRMSKSMKLENAFKDATIEQVYRLLLDSLAVESHRICFPDLAVLPVLQLRSFLKKCKQNKYTQKLRGALNKIEENSKFIEDERKRSTLELTDKKAVETWEILVRTKGTPLNTFCDSLKKIQKWQDAKQITQNDKLGEFNIPVLKKGEKRRNREEKVVKLVPDESDDNEEDETTLFRVGNETASINSDEEKEEQQPNKKRKKNVKQCLRNVHWVF